MKRWRGPQLWLGSSGSTLRIGGVRRVSKYLGVTMPDQRRHQKYRSQKAMAAWAVVRRLCKFPAKGKSTRVTQQLIPILTYSCELYPEASEQRRITNEMYRWVIGAYPGSRADGVQALCGLNDIGVVMQNKRIRWAASVYTRHLPELREIVEPILQVVVEEDVELRWIGGGRGRVEIAQEWPDGSCMEGRAAGSTRTRGC